MTADNIKLLEQYALDNYEIGGHWIVECWANEDYVELLNDCNNDLEEAKSILRSCWNRTNEQAAECRWE